MDLPPEDAEIVDATVVQPDYGKLGEIGGPKNFKLNEERFRLIIQLIQAGNYENVAATAAGLTQDSLRRYRLKGQAAERIVIEEFGEDHSFDETTLVNPLPGKISDNDWVCCRFSWAVLKAEAQGEAYAVGVVRKAMGEGHWAAAMTFLERKHPERWRRRDRLEVAAVAEGADDGLLSVEAQGHLNDALRAATAGEITESTDSGA